MKKYILSAVLLGCLTACDNADEPETNPYNEPRETLIILNNGNWGSNDAGVTRYDVARGDAWPGYFNFRNGRAMGDLGQDMILADDVLYIAMNGSQLIYATDPLTMTVEAEIRATDRGGQTLSPRYFSAGPEGKLYVTYYEGYVAEIDTHTQTVTRMAAVGNSPEGVTYCSGRLYVANSGGANYPNYDHTVSVIDAAKMEPLATVEVNLNPQMVIADHAEDGVIYVSSFGDYYLTPAIVERVDTRTGERTDLGFYDVKALCAGPEGHLLIATGGYDAQWRVTGTVTDYDMATGATRVITPEPLLNFYSLSYAVSPAPSASSSAPGVLATSPGPGHIYVGLSDYVTTGEVVEYDYSGTLIAHRNAYGLNPIKCMVGMMKR